MAKLTARAEAEAIEAFGEALLKLDNQFTRLCSRMSPAAIERIEAVEHQEYLSTIAGAFRALGDALCRECDEAEEADDRRRDNPLEPDFRRAG